jgi:hypothetical protein
LRTENTRNQDVFLSTTREGLSIQQISGVPSVAEESQIRRETRNNYLDNYNKTPQDTGVLATPKRSQEMENLLENLNVHQRQGDEFIKILKDRRNTNSITNYSNFERQKREDFLSKF